jgi:hypothetical protein
VFSKYSRCLPFSKWRPKHGIKKGEERRKRIIIIIIIRNGAKTISLPS